MAGCDEVSYSPVLAGDCVVCALVKTGEFVQGVKDSKMLSSVTRKRLFPLIKENSTFSVVRATPEDINYRGLYESRNMAMIGAIKRLNKKLGYTITDVIIDGYWSNKWLDIFEHSCNCRVRGMIRGDELVYVISAASIVAKICVDLLYDKYERMYPGYGLSINHGTSSVQHIQKLQEQGPTPIHRTGYQKEWWKRILGERYLQFIDNEV